MRLLRGNFLFYETKQLLRKDVVVSLVKIVPYKGRFGTEPLTFFKNFT